MKPTQFSVIAFYEPGPAGPVLQARVHKKGRGSRLLLCGGFLLDLQALPKLLKRLQDIYLRALAAKLLDEGDDE